VIFIGFLTDESDGILPLEPVEIVENPLSKLALDYWYQVLMVVSIMVFLLSGAGLLKAFPTAPTALISLGGFWIGLGEWVNHPLQTGLLPRSAYYPSGIVSGHPRRPSALGSFFLLFGFILVAWGIYKLFR
jgi:hypothetical protein